MAAFPVKIKACKYNLTSWRVFHNIINYSSPNPLATLTYCNVKVIASHQCGVDTSKIEVAKNAYSGVFKNVSNKLCVVYQCDL